MILVSFYSNLKMIFELAQRGDKMGRPTYYKTRQREAIFEYIISQKGNHVTVNQIAEFFRTQNTSMGITTIYRHLDNLVREGQVKKYLLDGITGACFQYIDRDNTSHTQYHLKCEGCGELFHTQCNVIDELAHHMGDSHNFELNTGKTIFYGKCGNCSIK